MECYCGCYCHLQDEDIQNDDRIDEEEEENVRDEHSLTKKTTHSPIRPSQVESSRNTE